MVPNFSSKTRNAKITFPKKCGFRIKFIRVSGLDQKYLDLLLVITILSGFHLLFAD